MPVPYHTSQYLENTKIQKTRKNKKTQEQNKKNKMTNNELEQSAYERHNNLKLIGEWNEIFTNLS